MPQTKRSLSDRQLQEKADQLFACCLQFLVGKEECFLEQIRDLSEVLLEEGYETSFQHKRRILVIKTMFAQLTQCETADEKLLPRIEDLKGLPDGQR